MAVKRVHVSGDGDDLTTELIAPGESRRVRSILITNAESNQVNVRISLFIETPSSTGKAFGTSYIIRNVDMPGGSSILLDDPAVFSLTNEQGLYAACLDNNNLDITIS